MQLNLFYIADVQMILGKKIIELNEHQLTPGDPNLFAFDVKTPDTNQVSFKS